MTLILIVLLIVLLAGGGWGWRAGYVGPGAAGNPIGLLLLIVLILIVLGAFGGPHFGWW